MSRRANPFGNQPIFVQGWAKGMQSHAENRKASIERVADLFESYNENGNDRAAGYAKVKVDGITCALPGFEDRQMSGTAEYNDQGELQDFSATVTDEQGEPTSWYAIESEEDGGKHYTFANIYSSTSLHVSPSGTITELVEYDELERPECPVVTTTVFPTDHEAVAN